MAGTWRSLIIACAALAARAIFPAAAANAAEPPPISYPQPTPGAVPVVFLPGLICQPDSLEFNAAFSPDGRSFYFTRSIGGQWDIYLSRFDGRDWSPPTRASFSADQYSEADPAFAEDGRLFFISNRPKAGTGAPADFDIWFVEPTLGGSWSVPRNATEFNSDHDEYYISFAKSGDAYFGSDRPGGFGSMDIYVSHRVQGHYTPGENLGPAINTAASEHDACLVSDDGSLLVFKSEDRPDGIGQADLYASRRDPDGRWSQAVNLGPSVNTPTYEYCSYLTPDGRFFFFSSELEIKWMDAGPLRRHIHDLVDAKPPAPAPGAPR